MTFMGSFIGILIGLGLGAMFESCKAAIIGAIVGSHWARKLCSRSAAGGIARTFGLFFVTAVAELAGCY